MLNQKNLKSVTFCPLKWSRTIWPRASWLSCLIEQFDLSMPVPSCSIHLRGSLRPEKSSNSFCHCDICPTFLQHLWDVSQCDFGPRFGRFLRPSTEFICFRSTHPWVAKYWQVLKHTLELCSPKQPFEAERTLFYAFLRIFSSFTVFICFLSSTLRNSSNLDFKCQQMNRAILQAST